MTNLYACATRKIPREKENRCVTREEELIKLLVVDLVEVEDVSVHVAAPRERVPAYRTRVRLGFPHDRYLGGDWVNISPTLVLLSLFVHRNIPNCSRVFKPYLTKTCPEMLRKQIWNAATFPHPPARQSRISPGKPLKSCDLTFIVGFGFIKWVTEMCLFMLVFQLKTL